MARHRVAAVSAVAHNGVVSVAPGPRINDYTAKGLTAQVDKLIAARK